MKKVLSTLALATAMISTSGASQMGQKAAGAINQGGEKVATGMEKGTEAMNNALKAGTNKITQAVDAMGDIEKAVNNNVELTQQQAQQFGTVCKAVTQDVLVVGTDVKENISKLCKKGKGLRATAHDFKERAKRHFK